MFSLFYEKIESHVDHGLYKLEYTMCEPFFQVFQQPFGDRGKDLIFFPDQIDACLKLRGEGAKGKPAVRTDVDEVPADWRQSRYAGLSER